MISPEMQRVITLLETMQAAAPKEMTPHKVRAGLEQLAAMAKPPKDGVYEPVDAGGVPAEWIFFAGADDKKVILFFHGGGYVAGSVDTHREFLAHIARATKRRILAVDYRLAPEDPFPAALDDATAAYRWLLADRQISPENIAIGGDSAGGGLTLATLLKLKEDGDTLPGAAICLSPWTDLAMTGASIAEKDSVDPFISASGIAAIAPAYIGDDDAKTPLISPLYGDLSGLPPVLIHVGGRECLLDDSVRFAEKAQAAGSPVTLKIWEELFHVFHLFAGVAPEGKDGIREVAAFLEAV